MMGISEILCKFASMKQLLTILGPTASGKTTLATRLAYEHLGLKAPETGSPEDNGQQSLF